MQLSFLGTATYGANPHTMAHVDQQTQVLKMIQLFFYHGKGYCLILTKFQFGLFRHRELWSLSELYFCSSEESHFWHLSGMVALPYKYIVCLINTLCPTKIALSNSSPWFTTTNISFSSGFILVLYSDLHFGNHLNQYMFATPPVIGLLGQATGVPHSEWQQGSIRVPDDSWSEVYSC